MLEFVAGFEVLGIGREIAFGKYKGIRMHKDQFMDLFGTHKEVHAVFIYHFMCLSYGLPYISAYR